MTVGNNNWLSDEIGEVLCMGIGSNIFFKEMFSVQLPGFKSGVGWFTWLFIPKQEHLPIVCMPE